MSETTRSMIEGYESQWEGREAISYRRQPRRAGGDPRRHRKAPRRVGLGMSARSTRRSTYKAERVARRSAA